MDKEAIWTLFEETGSIDAYMLYADLKNTDQEDSPDADEDRRAGN